MIHCKMIHFSILEKIRKHMENILFICTFYHVSYAYTFSLYDLYSYVPLLSLLSVKVSFITFLILFLFYLLFYPTRVESATRICCALNNNWSFYIYVPYKLYIYYLCLIHIHHINFRVCCYFFFGRFHRLAHTFFALSVVQLTRY